MFNQPTKYTKAERQTQTVLAQSRQTETNLLMVRFFFAGLISFIGIAIATYVHIYAGHETVMWIFGGIGLLLIIMLYSYMNDRVQERQMMFALGMLERMTGGVNSAITEAARTTGALNRADIRLDTQRRMIDQRQDAVHPTFEVLEDTYETIE